MRKRERVRTTTWQRRRAYQATISISSPESWFRPKQSSSPKRKEKRNHCKSRFSATMLNWWGDLRDLWFSNGNCLAVSREEEKGSSNLLCLWALGEWVYFVGGRWLCLCLLYALVLYFLSETSLFFLFFFNIRISFIL